LACSARRSRCHFVETSSRFSLESSSWTGFLARHHRCGTIIHSDSFIARRAVPGAPPCWIIATIQRPDAMIRQMAKPEFLQKLGVFIVREFFDPYQCGQLCAEIGAASYKPATVLETAEVGYVLDENFRKVLRTEPSQSAEALVRSRLHELKPKLEEHFQITL